METKSALIRSDRTVELAAIAFVYLHLAVIVNPCNTERKHTLRLNKSFKKTAFLIFRMSFNYRLD